MKLFLDNIYKDKKVLLTGHTGFKGSWLALLLKELGAEVIGLSLEPPTNPNHYGVLDLNIESNIIDIRNREEVEKLFQNRCPDIVFHLAAQPLVRFSYKEPALTYETNVIGTLNVLEACRKTESVKAVVCITTDKCYENKEVLWSYSENDPMGGYDPYSSSKGCAELLAASYRSSYFNNKKYNIEHNCLLATARAGNVIGGGDWADDRLIPDIVKATSLGKKVLIRNPKATRPWQHVLEPLRGYLMLGEKLLNGKTEFAEGWNFGPNDDANVSVGEVVTELQKCWYEIEIERSKESDNPHEANLLMLDCSKAKKELHWHPVISPKECFNMTASWYKNYYQESKIISTQQIREYLKLCELDE